VNWLAGELTLNTLFCTSSSPRPRPRLRVFLVTSGQRSDELKLIGWRSSYLVLSCVVVGRRRGYNEPRRMYLDGSERIPGEHLRRHPRLSGYYSPVSLDSSLLAPRFRRRPRRALPP
jgi:hypothetical protein